ncbi:MAG TPA: hypothetical protein VG407_07180 [Caulobacteraceae bacterium]|jgi:hypothetical protein|nr:hypothetical protein [Caulobacteraceae bacterium]
MSFIDPDRALKRLVAKLAQATADDVEAILRELDTQARERVQSLLAACHGETSLPVDHGRAHLKRRDLSPWLRDRLLGSAGREMTPTALAALQEAAASLPARAARSSVWRAQHWSRFLRTLAGARFRQERSA